MKRLLSAIFVIAILATAGYSADNKVSEKTLQMAEKAYSKSLNSDNAGIRASALYNIAKMKSRFPNYDFEKLEKSVVELAKKDSDSLIRANANLTYIYMNSPELAKNVKISDTENPLMFFNEVYNTLYSNAMAL